MLFGSSGVRQEGGWQTYEDVRLSRSALEESLETRQAGPEAETPRLGWTTWSTADLRSHSPRGLEFTLNNHWSEFRSRQT